MTLENVETVEEILFVNKDRNFDESRGDSWTEESGTKRQSVRSDQLTTHEQVRETFYTSLPNYTWYVVHLLFGDFKKWKVNRK